MSNNLDPISMTMGWLVGRRIAGQRGKKQKEPIAYLYNGVRLPKLPEWDKETYPYAVIGYMVNLKVAYLFCGEVEFKISVGTLGSPDTVFLHPTATTTILIYSYEHGQSGWTEIPPLKSEYAEYEVVWSATPNNYFAWANHDVLNEDNTVYLIASEPIPVYE